MQKSGQLRNYEKATESWQRRGETSCSKDSQDAFSPFGKWRERNSTEKKSSSYYYGSSNRRFGGQAQNSQHHKVIRQTFRNGRNKRTMDLQDDELRPSSSLDLKISNSNAEFIGQGLASPTPGFKEATPFSLSKLQDETPEALMFEDQALPASTSSIHQTTEGSEKSSAHTADRFKTPNAGDGKSDFGGVNSSFRQSVAKRVLKTPPKFDVEYLESGKQHQEQTLAAEGNSLKEEKTMPPQNCRDSFESYNGGLLCKDGNAGRHRASTETVLDMSLMHGWSVQTGGTVINSLIDKTKGEKELGLDPVTFANSSMEMDASQNGELRINCNPIGTTDADEAAILGVESNKTPHLPAEPESAEMCENNAESLGVGANRRSGNIIAMGRQSKIISNILNSGQFIKQKRTGSSLREGRTTNNQKQYSTERRSNVGVSKVELKSYGQPEQARRSTASRNGDFNNADQNDQHRTLPATKRPMEPMIIQRPAGQKQKTSRNQMIDDHLESKFPRNLSRSRGNSQSQTRVTSAQTSSNDVSHFELQRRRMSTQNPISNQSSCQMPTQIQHKKEGSSTQLTIKAIAQQKQQAKRQKLSFSGLTMDQLAKRRNSKSKKKIQQQVERVSILSQNASVHKRKSQDLDKLYFSGFSAKNGGKSKHANHQMEKQMEREMNKLNMNAEPRVAGGQREIQGKSQKKQKKTKMATGISEYIKMLKNADLNRSEVRSTLELCDNTYAKNRKAHRNSQDQRRFSSISSIKSLRAHSVEKSLNNKVNDSVVLAQEYRTMRTNKANSRKSSAARSINILNNSAHSLHSSLSAALPRRHLTRIQERVCNGGSRNNSNGYNTQHKTSSKASAGASQDQLNITSCSNQLRRPIRLSSSRYQPGSTKNHQSRNKLIEDSPSYGHFQSTCSLTGTFEDYANMQEKQRIEQEKLQKFQRAKRQANNYIRGDSAQKSLEQQQRQQQRIQKKLFQRYRIDEESNEGRTTEQTTEKVKPQEQEKEIDIVIVKTPEKLTKKRRSNMTPDQKKSYQKLSNGVKFLKYNLGAILKGYKVRQVYRNNVLIQQYRAEFRDQMRFETYLQLQAYRINLQLKRCAQDPILEVQKKCTDETHVKTLKQIQMLRQKFSDQFNSTIQSTGWLNACKPKKMQDIAKPEKQQKNSDARNGNESYYDKNQDHLESMKSNYLKAMEAKVQESNLPKEDDEIESQRTLSYTQQVQDPNPSSSVLSSIQNCNQFDLHTVQEAMTETETTVVEVKVDARFKEAPNPREAKRERSYMSPTKCSIAKRRTEDSAKLFSSPRHDKSLDQSQVTMGRQRASVLQKSSQQVQTPEKSQSFISKIPRCTSSVKKAQQTYLQGPTKIPKLNLGNLNTKDANAKNEINLMNQKNQISVQSKKSASISSQQNASQEVSTFDNRLSQIKKQSADLRKNVLSFNCTANFEHFKLASAEEEEPNVEVEVVEVDASNCRSNDEQNMLSSKLCSDISQCQEMLLQAPGDGEDHQQQQKCKQLENGLSGVIISKFQSSIFSKHSQMSSYPLSKRSTPKNTTPTNINNRTDSRQSERSQNTPNANTRYHDQKILSGQKFQHKKVEPSQMRPSCSPPKNLKDISISDHKSQQRSEKKNKRSPNKENLEVLQKKPDAVSVPVSTGKRRPRNERSCTKLDERRQKRNEKPKTVPFAQQDTNSPTKLRTEAPEDKSEVKIKQTVNQIQDMINQLQITKHQNGSNDKAADEIYKEQFEQMMNALKMQFQELTE